MFWPASLTVAEEFSFRPTLRLARASSGVVGADGDCELEHVPGVSDPREQLGAPLERRAGLRLWHREPPLQLDGRAHAEKASSAGRLATPSRPATRRRPEASATTH